jgi:CheY-like chemotaxis protein
VSFAISRISNDPSAPSRPASSPSEKAAGLSGPIHVLVVDDVRDTREMYERYLRFMGARVGTAVDGVEALGVIALQRPDALVLDLAMPRMTGWEVLRRLRSDRRTRGIPVVVLSGQNARESAIEAGADGYLEKPCSPEDLYREILRLLRGTPAPR